MAEEGAAPGAAAPAASEKIIHTYPLIRPFPVYNGVGYLIQEIWREYGFYTERLPSDLRNPEGKPYSFLHSDMSEEMRNEAMELSVTACEKYSHNNELAARMVKEAMDKKFGPAFHVVVGESYGFEITYECTTICYLYFGGNQAICMWKCS